VPTPDTDVDKSKEPSETVVAGSIEPQDPLRTESLDLLDEGLLKDERARATGFVGKNSEVHWLWSIILRLERTDDESVKTTRSGTTFERCGSLYGAKNMEMSVFAFYLNNENMDLEFFVDPYGLPMLDTAEHLLECYMETVHDSFPILPRKKFKDEFFQYFNTVRNANAPRLSPKWQAILNLVFAIGAKYSHLVKASWRGDERDHLIQPPPMNEPVA
jgi:hypothetical protein